MIAVRSNFIYGNEVNNPQSRVKCIYP
jgi:hypothetical protein